MLKIGRYGIALGPVLWFQTKVPSRVWHFLCFWFIKEARPNDVDRKKQFPIGTPMEHDGRTYRYWKAEEKDNLISQELKDEEERCGNDDGDNTDFRLWMGSHRGFHH
ncbi:hypothetical protein ES703_00673 [subsurface metagenome]